MACIQPQSGAAMAVVPRGRRLAQPASRRMNPVAGHNRHLLFVINAAIRGGAENHTMQLARGLSERGFRTSVFAIKHGTERPADVGLREPAAGESLGRRIRAFAHVLRNSANTVIVPVNQRPLAVAFFARMLARSTQPITPIFHTTMLRSRKERWMQRIYTPLFNRSDRVIFVSNNQRRHWEREGIRNARAVTILNGIDTKRFAPAGIAPLRAPARQALGLDDGDLVLGCIAVLRAEKNQLQLVDAVARLREDGVPARALIVGDGPLRSHIMARAAGLNVTPHIVFTGMQDDVRPYLAALDIGVLCSVTETLSLSALEVMAAGKPMVMSNVGGASEIVDGVNGLTFPAGDTDALISAIRQLAGEARFPAGAAASATIASRFDERLMIENYAALFANMRAMQ